MRAEFYRPEDPDRIVGSAEWDGHHAVVKAEDEAIRSVLSLVFHASPVATSDTDGAGSVFEPGSLEWFRVAARVRGEREGLKVRFAVDHPGGWDPALDPQTYGWGGSKPSLPHER